MKTISEIEVELKQIIGSAKLLPKLKASTKNKIKLLRHVKMYLETNPDKEVVERQLKLIKNEIDIIESRYGLWSKNITPVDFAKAKGNTLKYYQKLNGLPIKKAQIKTLKYILS